MRVGSLKEKRPQTISWQTQTQFCFLQKQIQLKTLIIHYQNPVQIQGSPVRARNSLDLSRFWVNLNSSKGQILNLGDLQAFWRRTDARVVPPQEKSYVNCYFTTMVVVKYSRILQALGERKTFVQLYHWKFVSFSGRVRSQNFTEWFCWSYDSAFSSSSTLNTGKIFNLSNSATLLPLTWHVCISLLGICFDRGKLYL